MRTSLHLCLLTTGLLACTNKEPENINRFGELVEICDEDGDEDTDGVEGCDDSDCWSDACEEVCDSPGDEDGDGLQNCEDPECLVDGNCVETTCDDSVDNDNDGLTDCADDDCWGLGCAVREVQFTEVTATPDRDIYLYNYTETCGQEVYQTLSSSHSVYMPGIAGVLRNHTVNGATSTCAFTGELAIEHVYVDRALLRSIDGQIRTDVGCLLSWTAGDVVDFQQFDLGPQGAVFSAVGGRAMFTPLEFKDFRDIPFTSTSSGRSSGCNTVSRSVSAIYSFPMAAPQNARIGVSAP